MNREEFNALVTKYGDLNVDFAFAMSSINTGKMGVLTEQLRENNASILAEFDRLTAEIERLKGAQEGKCSIDVELERK